MSKLRLSTIIHDERRNACLIIRRLAVARAKFLHFFAADDLASEWGASAPFLFAED